MLIKVGDTVKVTSGNYRGKTGKVLRVNQEAGKIVVESVNIVHKHVRKSQKNPQGGVLKKEMPIDASNVMLLDPQTHQPTRVGVRYLADGSKERYAKRSGASMGAIAPARARYATASKKAGG